MTEEIIPIETPTYDIDGVKCIIFGDYYVSVETGEEVALAISPEFTVNDIDSCHWVLRKFQKAEAERHAR